MLATVGGTALNKRSPGRLVRPVPLHALFEPATPEGSAPRADTAGNTISASPAVAAFTLTGSCPMIQVLVAFSAATTVAFLSLAAGSRLQVRQMSQIARAQAIIDEHGRKSARLPVKERILLRLSVAGYTGDLPTFGVMTAALFVFVSFGFTLLGFADWQAMIAAVPGTLLVASVVLGRIAAKRRAKFNAQLLQSLDMIAANIAAGTGPQRSIEQVLSTASEPLRSEFRSALDSAVASKDLPAALRDVATRYPSRAFELFIAALEIDRDMGGRIEPALRQASSIMRRNFELEQETASELSQSKAEFWGLIGVIGFMAATLFASSPEGNGPLDTPIGTIITIIAFCNIGLGIWRAQRLISGQQES